MRSAVCLRDRPRTCFAVGTVQPLTPQPAGRLDRFLAHAATILVVRDAGVSPTTSPDSDGSPRGASHASLTEDLSHLGTDSSGEVRSRTPSSS